MTQVRRASHDDVDVLAEMCMAVQALHVALKPSLFQQPAAQQLAEFFDARLVDPDFAIFIAWNEFGPIGYVMLHVVHRPTHVLVAERQYVEIDQIHVEERYQRQGVGRRLTSEAVKLARSLKIDTIQLNVWAENHPAVTAFDAMGFIPQRHIMVLDDKAIFEQVRGGNA